jgi:UDP-2,3-diacylglucosamine pyrophosphatase LpxH
MTLIGKQQSAARSTHNLLVVSDLHFGETLAPTDPGYVKQVARLNQAFCRFLEYYADHRVDERPWRLVIAGDMIDFLRVSVVATQEIIGTEHLGAAGAVRALEKIVGHHRRMFRDLAAFVGASNELVIIKGNHDAEFHWPDVQRRLTEILIELHASLETRSLSDDEVSSRITFSRWFWYERDLVYIEHGNQYDEFCSFDHVLSPEIPDEKQLEDPISHQTFRAFANLVPTLDTHKAETWKLLDWTRWVIGVGPRMMARLAYTYFASLSWMIDTRRRLARAAKKAREEHRRRVSELAQKFRLAEDVVQALDELRHRPAGISVFAGIQMLYMDRIFLGVLTLLVVLGAVLIPDSGVIRASTAGGFATGSVLLFFWLWRQRQVEAHPKLLRVAKKVRELVKVPFVVFGHSHVPVSESITDGWYFNTGSWSGDAKGGLTHLCITVANEVPIAELRRWDIGTHSPKKLEL